ncbi:MAG: hypothetical protein GY865_06665 [candidate division Zixibacteria bacterium]|nr:hypothetical protein [candidate division Zixibacteria bacterium]
MYLLKIKAWRLFILLFGAPFLSLFIGLVIGIAVGNPAIILPINSIIMVFSMVVFLGWLWSMGANINLKVSEEIRLKSVFFKYAILYCAIYAVLFSIFYLIILNLENPGSLFSIFPFIIPFHLFAMYLMMYINYFVSKNLVMAEKKRDVVVSDYISTFFMIWFYPIGVWIVQPRVNQLFNDD